MPRGTNHDGPALRRRIMGHLQEWIDDRGYPPTVRELCTALDMPGTNTSVVAHHLTVLEAEGYVRREPRIARGLTVLKRI